MDWLLTTPTWYTSLFPKSRENWLRSMSRWQMDSVALPETWNCRWHLIYDNKEHPSSNQPLAFIFVMSSACRWLTWDSEEKAEHCQGAHVGWLLSPHLCDLQGDEFGLRPFPTQFWFTKVIRRLSVVLFFFSCSVLCLKRIIWSH